MGTRVACDHFLFLHPLAAIFIGRIPVDGVNVIERVAAEVLAAIFYDDLRADEMVRGVASRSEGAIPSEVGFFQLLIELGHAGSGGFGGEVINPEADEF